MNFLGVAFAVISGFIGLIASMNNAFLGGCGPNIECVMIPKLGVILVIISVLFFLFLAAFVKAGKNSKVNKLVIIYCVTSGLLVFSIFSFQRGRFLYNLVEGSRSECSWYSGTRKDRCYSDEAKRTNNVVLCDKVSNPLIYKEDCINYFERGW